VDEKFESPELVSGGHGEGADMACGFRDLRGAASEG
jgi:hypothetical protein